MKNWIVVVIVILVAGFAAFYLTTEERRLASKILNVRLPSSVSGVECDSWGLTDTLTTCVFEVHPDDFDALLEGREFEQELVAGSSHEFGMGPKVGVNFEVANQYFAHPTAFVNGGYISVVTNQDKNRVSIDIYVE